MRLPVKDFWNQRYAESEYSYGTEPNAFLKDYLGGLAAGKVLFPAEGEGRNAVYAASLGWNVWAFDYSSSGREKALKLGAERNVDLHYHNFSYEELPHDWQNFDLIALIYAHMPDPLRQQIHPKLAERLAPGGRIVLEAFNPDQIGRSSGGPKDEKLLYTPEKLRSDFSALTEELCETRVVHLAEGQYHNGEAAVIRYVGQKV